MQIALQLRLVCTGHFHKENVRALVRLACCLQLARKDGATPLHEAAAAGHTEVAKVLMSVGATPDVTDVVSRPGQNFY